MSEPPIDTSKLLARATTNDPKAVSALFSGFMGNEEQLLDCGYLGTLGFIFVEHSFWCVTPYRACSLMIKRGGECSFTSGYLEHINSEAFYQPSLVMLWVVIVIVALFTWGIGLLLTPWIVKNYYKLRKSGVVFWVGQGIPIYVFADRKNLRRAQQVAIQIGKAKKNLLT